MPPASWSTISVMALLGNTSNCAFSASTISTRAAASSSRQSNEWTVRSDVPEATINHPNSDASNSSLSLWNQYPFQIKAVVQKALTGPKPEPPTSILHHSQQTNMNSSTNTSNTNSKSETRAVTATTVTVKTPMSASHQSAPGVQLARPFQRIFMMGTLTTNRFSQSIFFIIIHSK